MSLAPALPAQIIELVHAEGLAVGSHLPAQWLADRLRVSRSPVNEALGLLQSRGIVRREPNRGYFLAAATPPRDDPRGDAQGRGARSGHRAATSGSPRTGCAASCPTASPRRGCAAATA